MTRESRRMIVAAEGRCSGIAGFSSVTCESLRRESPSSADKSTLLAVGRSLDTFPQQAAPQLVAGERWGASVSDLATWLQQKSL